MALLLGWTVPATQAHTFSTLRGLGIIEDGNLSLTLSGGAEDYLHDGGLVPAAGDFPRGDIEDCVRRYADALLSRLILRDEAGRRIDGRVVSARLAGSAARPASASAITYDELRRTLVEYVLRYDVSQAGRHISLQQTPADDAGALLTGIAVAIRPADGGGVTEVTLTNGGNVEVVELGSDASARSAVSSAEPVAAISPAAGISLAATTRSDSRATCNRRAFILTDAFKTLRGVVEISGERVEVTIYVPAPMVETWMPMPRAARDFLDPAEQEAAAADFAQRCAERIRLSTEDVRADGAASAGDTTTVGRTSAAVTARFLGIGEVEENPAAAPARLSYWTSRLLVRLSYPLPPSPVDVTIEWHLFNSTVVAAPVLIIADGQCREHDVSTYASTVALPRRPPLGAEGG